MLIDTGVGKTYAESIKPALVDLNAKGVRALEAVVITHLDRDHKRQSRWRRGESYGRYGRCGMLAHRP